MATAEQFLIDTLTNPKGILSEQLRNAANEAGITWEQITQARTRLGVTSSWVVSGQGPSLFLNPRPCIACGAATPYVEADHRLPLCPACASPITTSRWERIEMATPLRFATVTAAHRPDGWPANEGLPGGKTCNTVLARARTGRPACTEAVVWKVTVLGIRCRVNATAYYCDTDLPSKNRPRTEEN